MSHHWGPWIYKRIREGERWIYKGFIEGAENIDHTYDDFNVGGEMDFYKDQCRNNPAWPREEGYTWARAWWRDESCIIRAVAVSSGVPFGTVWQRAIELWGGRHALQHHDWLPGPPWGGLCDYTSDDLNRQMAALAPYLAELGFTKIVGNVAWNNLPTDRSLIVVIGEEGGRVSYVTGIINGVIHDERDERLAHILGRYEGVPSQAEPVQPEPMKSRGETIGQFRRAGVLGLGEWQRDKLRISDTIVGALVGEGLLERFDGDRVRIAAGEAGVQVAEEVSQNPDAAEPLYGRAAS
jgi:hypothetical protein